jgi:hypothetical protein
MSNIQIINQDCLLAMKEMPDNAFDLATEVRALWLLPATLWAMIAPFMKSIKITTTLRLTGLNGINSN